jgi:hypothetical protein
VETDPELSIMNTNFVHPHWENPTPKTRLNMKENSKFFIKLIVLDSKPLLG